MLLEYYSMEEKSTTFIYSKGTTFAEEFALTEQGTEIKDYKEIVVKLAVSKDYLRKLELLINTKRIFSSRAEALRRSLELLFDKYQEALKENQ